MISSFGIETDADSLVAAVNRINFLLLECGFTIIFRGLDDFSMGSRKIESVYAWVFQARDADIVNKFYTSLEALNIAPIKFKTT